MKFVENYIKNYKKNAKKNLYWAIPGLIILAGVILYNVQIMISTWLI